MKVQHIGPKLIGIGAFTALCLTIFVGLLFTTGYRAPWSNPYTLTVRVPKALQLVNNSDVRASGVKVGKVAKITDRGSQSDLELELDPKALPVYRDALVQVRTKTLVGENYIDLTRGSPRAGALPSGSKLPGSRAGETVQVDQILDALDPETRRHVQRTVRSFGAGLDGRGADLNASLAALQPTFQDGSRLMGVLAAQRTQLASLVQDAGDVMRSFGERSDAVRTLAAKLRQTAEAAASRDGEIRETVNELGPTLTQVRRSVTALGSLSRTATPVTSDLESSAADLVPAIRDLTPAARASRALVTEVRRILPDAEPLVRNLRVFATTAQPLAPAIDALLRQINPALAYLAPYNREFGAFFANVGALVDTHDALGQLGRVHALVSEASLVNWSPAMRKALEALLTTSGLSKFKYHWTNPYPAPGTVGDPKPATGDYTRVMPDSRR